MGRRSRGRNLEEQGALSARGCLGAVVSGASSSIKQNCLRHCPVRAWKCSQPLLRGNKVPLLLIMPRPSLPLLALQKAVSPGGSKAPEGAQPQGCGIPPARSSAHPLCPAEPVDSDSWAPPGPAEPWGTVDVCLELGLSQHLWCF